VVVAEAVVAGAEAVVDLVVAVVEAAGSMAGRLQEAFLEAAGRLLRHDRPVVAAVWLEVPVRRTGVLLPPTAGRRLALPVTQPVETALRSNRAIARLSPRVPVRVPERDPPSLPVV